VYEVTIVVSSVLFSKIHYEVLEKATGIHWAGKVVNKTACPAAALETELSILTQLHHPNTVRIKEVFNSDEVCIIVQEMYDSSPSTSLPSIFFTSIFIYTYRVTGGELFDRSKYLIIILLLLSNFLPFVPLTLARSS
jgi:hypothetical protein